ncbi:MAG: S41 family peptidase [Lachnospiraceae bacterium]|nr:S41 family peptidase [Lachnospiraceae bacterium]
MKNNDSFTKGMLAGVALAVGTILLALLIFFLFFKDGRFGNSGSSSGSGEVSVETEVGFINKQQGILNIIDDYYYEDVDHKVVYDGAYRGMLSALNDAYSCYYSPEEMEQITGTTGGEYVGIGCSVIQNKETKEISVLSVIEDSPAEKAGLKPDDIFLKLDGQDLSDLDLNYAMSLFQGKEGEELTITIVRDNTMFDVTLTRAKVLYKTTYFKMLDDEIGYVYMSAFYNHTQEQLLKAIEDLEQQGMKKLIIDVRDNPGGLYDVAVEIIDMMVPEDLVAVYTEDKKGEKNISYTLNKDEFDKPMVIIINENSASAAELFTQTMKDYEKATVVGTTSYGKGVYQELVKVGDGSGVKVTGGRYFSPKGVCINGVGVTPDIEVELAEEYKDKAVVSRETDNQVQAAVDFLKKN